MVEKVIRDGKVAVLVSPGFGAGWSTWAHEGRDFEEFLIFDKSLVELCERGGNSDEAEEIIIKEFGEETYIYTGGWEDVEIEWLDEGAPFYIHEYDGSESVVTGDNLYRVA